MAAAETIDTAALALNLVETGIRELALDSTEVDQRARDGARDFRDAVIDSISIAAQLDADMAELQSKRDLLPGAGFERLRREAVAEAKMRADEADQRKVAALELIKETLFEQALPKLDPDREALARQELALLIGEATAHEAAKRVIDSATANREMAAVVLRTSFAKTLLHSRGVSGRDYTDTIAGVRSIAAATAAEKSTNAREIIASKALERLPKLAAARGAAGDQVLNAIRNAGG